MNERNAGFARGMDIAFIWGATMTVLAAGFVFSPSPVDPLLVCMLFGLNLIGLAVIQVKKIRARLWE